MKRKKVVKMAALAALVTIVLLWRPAMADSTWTVYNQTNSPLPTDRVASIDFDAQGNQYIGTTVGGLVLKQGDQWTIWNQSNTGVPIDVARFARHDDSGNLWVGAVSRDLDHSPVGYGMARLLASDSSWSMQNLGLEISMLVSGIIIDGQTRYVSTYGGGITIYNDVGWIRYRYASRTEYTYADGQQHVINVEGGTYIPTDYIRAIDLDRTNSILWMITPSSGAVRKDGSQWSTFNMGNSGLPSNQLRSVKVRPSDGSVAFGTAGFGVAVFQNDVWTVFNGSNSPMTNGSVASLQFRPGDGEMWVGTGYGVWVLQPDSLWRGYLPSDNNFIWGDFYSDIAFDSSGSVWVSAYNGGMASLFLGSAPPPPDSLTIDVDRMFIYFYNHRPIERIFSELTVNGAPVLAPDDSVSFELSSGLGELYSFEISFGDFVSSGLVDDIYDTYRYKEDGLLVFLRINQADPSHVEMSIKDTDAGMNRENYQNVLTVTVKLGDVDGSVGIILSPGNQWDVPEFFGDDEMGPAQVYGLIAPAMGIEDDPVPLASRLNLNNYPNPFNGRTIISFNLQQGDYVTISVYDLLGRKVQSLYSGVLAPGEHNFGWPSAGLSVKSGVYIYRVSVGDESASRKMMYLR